MNIDKRNVKAKQDLRNRMYSNTDREMIEKEKNKKMIKGPRKIFLSYILEDKMRIEDAMAKFVDEHPIYSETDVIRWLRDEMRKNIFDNDVLVLIETYLKSKEKNKRIFKAKR